MTCVRCLGLMIEDQFLDLESPYGQMWATSLRCVELWACPRRDRAASPRPTEKGVARPSSEPDYQDDEVHLGAESLIRQAA